MTETETTTNVQAYTEELNEPKKGLKGLFNKFTLRKYPFTAQSCFIQSKYGEGTYREPADRIKSKQEDIRIAIENKFGVMDTRNSSRIAMYHCVVDIEEDLLLYAEQIFKPFYEGGFEIINLSKECKDIDTEGVYFISWKNAFKNKNID